jgi:hypothetical protein
LKYLEKIVANKNYIYEEVNIRLKRVQISLPSFSKYINIKTDKAIILLVVLNGFRTRSLALRENYTVRAFENRLKRRTFKPKIQEVTK